MSKSEVRLRGRFQVIVAGSKVLMGTLIIFPWLGSSPSLGQTRGVTVLEQGEVATAEAARSYWTPERFRNARPMLPGGAVNNASAPSPTPDGNVVQEVARRVPGAPPSVPLAASMREQILPQEKPADSGVRRSGEVAPSASDGTYGFFTTSRVFPDAAAAAYPNLTVGKLFFRDPKTSTDYVCSASVVRQRIVATAGHCVANPSTSSASRYFFTNFVFVPALQGTTGPLGSWTTSAVGVSNTWYYSSGSVPNAGDWGYLRISDRSISGTTRRIGDVTGYLGYSTGALSSNHLSVIGYPCNLDSCARMEITHAQIKASGGSNTYYLGSSMRGGASGGPWILDYGVRPVGTAPTQISQLGRNYLVGVTSYGPVSTGSSYLGASDFNSSWVSGLSTMCGATSTRNCAN